MHEILILNIIKKEIENLYNDLKTHFSKEDKIIWSPIPTSVSYDTEVDCAIIIAVSFKHLENDDDEGISIQVHINKSGSGNPSFIIDLDFTRLNGTAIEMNEIEMDLGVSKKDKKHRLKEVFNLLNSYYPIAKKVIVEEYLSRPPSIGNEGYISN
jgi:hypothetical protein